VVAGLTVLEEVVGVLSHAACHGIHRVQGAGAEVGQCLSVDERSEVGVLKHFDLLDLM
jgi:hypothetical protein